MNYDPPAGSHPTTTDDACGTPRGFRRHYRRGERPCAACKAAKRSHDRANPERVRLHRLHARACELATTELRHRHEREWRQLVAEAQERVGIFVPESKRRKSFDRSERPASPDSPTSLIERPPVMGREVLPLDRPAP